MVFDVDLETWMLLFYHLIFQSVGIVAHGAAQLAEQSIRVEQSSADTDKWYDGMISNLVNEQTDGQSEYHRLEEKCAWYLF